MMPPPPNLLSAVSPTMDSNQPRFEQGSRNLEPGLRSMIVAALVLLVAVGVVLWIASSTPNGRSVVVTIRTP
jgi:hypothetical protein